MLESNRILRAPLYCFMLTQAHADLG